MLQDIVFVPKFVLFTFPCHLMITERQVSYCQLQTRNDPIQRLPSMAKMISPLEEGAAINMDMPLNQNVNKSE
jgi:hypothetical protein